MTHAPDPGLDYARFGRQIALAELGPDGQQRLARAPVRFEPATEDDTDVARLALVLHQRAGGRVVGTWHDALALSVHAPAGPKPPWATLGAAAFAAVEAARQVLGHAPCPAPDGLFERLAAPALSTPEDDR